MLVKRKWGWYITLLDMRRFKVKLLYFHPKGEISLQKHRHRDEVWLFLKGSGVFKNGDKKNAVKSGDAKTVLKETWHHYRAVKRTIVLEIQTGSCKESDIIRA